MDKTTRLKRLERSIPRRPDIEEFRRDLHGKLVAREGETLAETKAAYKAAEARDCLLLEVQYVRSPHTTPEVV